MGPVLSFFRKTKTGAPQWASKRIQGVQLDLKNDTGLLYYSGRADLPANRIKLIEPHLMIVEKESEETRLGTIAFGSSATSS